MLTAWNYPKYTDTFIRYIQNIPIFLVIWVFRIFWVIIPLPELPDTQNTGTHTRNALG